MSWKVEGRLYHSYEKYQRALSQQRDLRLRRMAERFRVPPVDTSCVERQLAVSRVRQEALERLQREVEHDLEERRSRVRDHRHHISEAFDEIEQSESRLIEELESTRRDLVHRVGELEAKRTEQAKATSATLDREVEADRRTAADMERRKQELLSSAHATLRSLDPEQIRELGLEGSTVIDLLTRAGKAGATEGLLLARSGCDRASALRSEAIYRKARIEAMKDAFRAEIEELEACLQFSREDRVDLVGDLDEPLTRELERLGKKVDAIRIYEDHEVRSDRLGQALDALSVRINDLTSQVRDFDRLEDDRLDLVRNQLATKLHDLLGEEVQIDKVEPGALGLQPVEVKLRTATGERVDCTIHLDGTMRLHHYGHADPSACARAARRIAKSLPEMIAVQEAPQLDIAQRSESRDTRRPETAREIERSKLQ